jgi:Winged helix DNA-binding domain
MPTWFQPHHLERARELLAEVRALAPLSQKEAIARVQALGLDERDAHRTVIALRRHAHLLHGPETALWKIAPRVLLHPAPEPPELDGAAARTELVRRYLRAFGPASKPDFADWSGLRIRDVEYAFERLPTSLNEDGRTLYDVPRAPLPPADTPAPIRFLPKWDNTLLGHADRRRVMTDELRRQIVASNGDVVPTVLVDGFVRAIWRYDKSGVTSIEYVGPATRTQKAEVAAEADRISAWLR